MKSAKNGIILFDFMGEFYRSMKPLQTFKNTGMGYSAAYPTGAERCLFQSKSNRGKFSLGWLAGSVPMEVWRVFFFASR